VALLSNNTRRRSRAGTIDVVPRDIFLREWDYSNQHVTMLGPTQRGKTVLCIQLLDKVISPQHKATVLAGKTPNRDPVMAQAADKLNLRVIKTWPPKTEVIDRKKNGYLLRPTQTLDDIDSDNKELEKQFRAGIVGNYQNDKHPSIIVIDEAHLIRKDLGLQKECDAILTRGQPDTAEWNLSQRGRFLSYHTYSAPEHLFIFADPDASNQKRYSEIGGVDPKWILAIAQNLRMQDNGKGQTISECIYFRRSGPEVCIVGM